MMTLSSSLSVKVRDGEGDMLVSSGVEGSGWGGGGGAIGVVLGVSGDGSCAGEVVCIVDVGWSRGERRRGVGLVARPGVLFRVTLAWTRGVVRRVRGAVGLLDKVGSTLRGGAIGVFTLGACWELSWYISLIILMARWWRDNRVGS
jgi:hypothetical protein